MRKLVYCVRRRTDVSHEGFRRFWLEQHGPLFQKYASAIGMKRYVQSHAVETPITRFAQERRGMDHSYDDITECWWESLADLAIALQTTEGAEADDVLARDEAKFVDLANSCIFFTEEHTVFEP